MVYKDIALDQPEEDYSWLLPHHQRLPEQDLRMLYGSDEAIDSIAWYELWTTVACNIEPQLHQKHDLSVLHQLPAMNTQITAWNLHVLIGK